MTAKSLILISFLSLSLLQGKNLQACGEMPLDTVQSVELPRYLGTWYEIASFPQSFQKGCVGTTATYSQRQNGDIDVLNQCRLNTLDGKLKTAHGVAKVVDKTTNAKLKVSFFWPFYGKYWIIDLGQGQDYDYAVVGHPNRKYLWILSRTPKMDPAKYDAIVARVREQGFDPSRLKMTLQAERSKAEYIF